MRYNLSKLNNWNYQTLKSLIYMKGTPVVSQCWLQRCARLALTTEGIHTFSCFMSKLRGIFKIAESKPGSLWAQMQHACFFLCGCSTLLHHRLKFSH